MTMRLSCFFLKRSSDTTNSPFLSSTQQLSKFSIGLLELDSLMTSLNKPRQCTLACCLFPWLTLAQIPSRNQLTNKWVTLSMLLLINQDANSYQHQLLVSCHSSHSTPQSLNLMCVPSFNMLTCLSTTTTHFVTNGQTQEPVSLLLLMLLLPIMKNIRVLSKRYSSIVIDSKN